MNAGKRKFAEWAGCDLTKMVAVGMASKRREMKMRNNMKNLGNGLPQLQKKKRDSGAQKENSPQNIPGNSLLAQAREGILLFQVKICVDAMVEEKTREL